MKRCQGIDYTGCEVVVISSSKSSYQHLIGEEGYIDRDSQSSSIGVMMRDNYNNSSRNGTYWFKQNEIELIEKLGGSEMREFEKVAIVNLLEDYSKRNYGFALYESEWKKIKNPGTLVVVNPKGKNNRVLAVVKDIKTFEEYGKDVTAQVVGVVDTTDFDKREEESKTKAEINKKRKELEGKLRAKIEKLKDAEFYERMASEYSTKDPEIGELVAQLKEIGM